MIKSMTGFASLTHEDERATIGVTIKTVNHRFLDVQLRIPQSLAEIEPRVRALLQKRLARGRVEVAITVQLRTVLAPTVELNEDVVNALAAAIERARERGLVAGALTPGDLLRVPQAVSVRERPPKPIRRSRRRSAPASRPRSSRRWPISTPCGCAKATTCAPISTAAASCWPTWSIGSTARRSRAARASKRGCASGSARLAPSMPVDEALVAQEIVRTAARSDITEEVTRFRGHLLHWGALADNAEPCGRKLDFLLQEMNREINTIGSKADGLRVSELVITAKAELEKMREQVQNVE